MTDGPKEGFAFIVDTDQYAGNFEREMTAFLTGRIGDCEVGEELIEELPISFDNVLDVADDHGCYRPTSCWQSPDSVANNSVAIFFETRPTQEQIDFMKERVKSFDEARMAQFLKDVKIINILGFRLIEFHSTTKEEKV
jgi:hypothetical protein